MGCSLSKASSKALTCSSPVHLSEMSTPLSRLFAGYGPAPPPTRVIALDGEFQSFELRPEQQRTPSGLPLHWNDFHKPPTPGMPGPFSFMREIGVISFAASSAASPAPAVPTPEAEGDASAPPPPPPQPPQFTLEAAITRHLPLLYSHTAPTEPYSEPEAIQVGGGWRGGGLEGANEI